MKLKVFRGTFVHCKEPKKIEVLQDHLIGFDEECGKILFVQPSTKLEELSLSHEFDSDAIYCLSESQFLMPGLVDTHIHAPQYMFTGTGYDRQLLEWLDTYTFPTEAKFKDVEVAKCVYPLVVKRTLRHGTTTACYFATIHLESTKELCKIIGELGQRAFVGKVNMDQQSKPYYVEDTQKSIEETRNFVEHVKGMKNPLVEPIITPRFAPTCSASLLRALGDMAHEMGVRIQSHICEQKSEVDYTLSLFPDHKNSASIFEKSELLTDKTVMAHCIYLEDSEIDLFQKKGVGIASCPNSNFCLKSGILDVRRLLDKGLKIGLGTDVSGGFSPSMFDAIRSALHASKALSFNKTDDYSVLSHHEALYMATVGGARVLNLEDTIGNFEAGKQFDALLVDTKAPNPPVFDIFDQDTMDDIIMKFLYLGDDRNILKRFVAGKEISLD